MGSLSARPARPVSRAPCGVTNGILNCVIVFVFVFVFVFLFLFVFVFVFGPAISTQAGSVEDFVRPAQPVSRAPCGVTK